MAIGFLFHIWKRNVEIECTKTDQVFVTTSNGTKLTTKIARNRRNEYAIQMNDNGKVINAYLEHLAPLIAAAPRALPQERLAYSGKQEFGAKKKPPNR